MNTTDDLAAAAEFRPEGAEIEDEERIRAAAGETPAHPRRPSDLTVAHALKDALLAGIVALGMFGPLLGFETLQNIDNKLVLATRWPLLFIVVAIVAVGRFVIVLFVQPALASGRGRRQARAALRKKQPSRFGRFALPGVIVATFLYPMIGT